MKLTGAIVIVLAGLALGACEKDPGLPASKPSGALSAPEVSLLSRLPAGANVVFGGNMYEAQKWLSDSALGRMAQAMLPPEMKAWNACLAEQKLSMAGAGEYKDGSLRLSIYMKDLTIDALRTCATRAGIPVTADPDGKALTVEVTAPNMPPYKVAYLAVDGGVYTRTSMDFPGLGGGGQPTVADVTRVDLEADQASVATASLARDARMTGWLAKVDRTRAFYFVGSGDGTAIADKVGLVYGAFDLKSGLDIDVTAELREPGMAGEMVSGFAKAKSQLGQVPPEMSAIKDVVRAIKIGKTAGGIRVVARISDAVLQKALDQIGPMLPMMTR